MKRIIVFLVFLLSLSLSIQAQRIKKDTIYSRFIVGMQPNISYRAYYFYDGPREKAQFLSLEPRLYAGYNLYKNFYLGAEFGYEFLSSNFYQKENFIEYGAFVRYWIPYFANTRMLRRLKLYLQLSYNRTNYRKVSEIVNTVEYKGLKVEEDFIISESLDQTKLAFPVGLTYRLTRYMYVDLNWQYQKFINGVGVSGFMAGIGFNLGERHSRIKKTK